VLDVLREKGVYLAAWLPTLMMCVAAAMAGLIWLLRRDPRMSRRIPRTLAGFLLPLCMIGLCVAYGPMAPLFRSAEKLHARIGEPAPDMAFTAVADRQARHLSDFRGKVLLVNLWATWCPPCRAELPTLNRLQEELAGRGLVVVTLSDESPDALAPFLEQHAPRTVNGCVDSFGWLAIKKFRPFTLLIDRTGVLRDYSFGSQDYATFARKVEKYL
jgi:thiol-disulfide isomerase/thioredoxin